MIRRLLPHTDNGSAGTKVFVKRDVQRDEWLRARALYEASLAVRSFNAPEPLEYQEQQSIILYRRLPKRDCLGWYLVKELICPRHCTERIRAVLHGVGSALADLHAHLLLPGTQLQCAGLEDTQGIDARTRAHISRAFDSAEVRCFHGDFGTGNVLVGDEQGVPIIIDPVPSRFCPDRRASRASIYYDLGHMTSTLYGVYPLWTYPLLDSVRLEPAVEAFLTGYESTSSLSIDRTVVYGVALWLYDAYVVGIHATDGIRWKAVRRRFHKSRRAALLREVIER